MEQVAAKQRIKVATKDHMLISVLHVKLHRRAVYGWMFILSLLTLAIFILAVSSRSSVDEWKVTDLQGGIVSCRNVNTGKTKKFKPQKSIIFEITVENYVLRLQKSDFWRVRVGDLIILRDDGWFDEGNNLVSTSQEYTIWKEVISKWNKSQQNKE